MLYYIIFYYLDMLIKQKIYCEYYKYSQYYDELSPRLQRLRMKMMHYDFEVFHSPGKEIVAADCLSRAPVKIDLTQVSEL